MNFILQTVSSKVTLDMSFAMERAIEYWLWRDKTDSIDVIYRDYKTIDTVHNKFAYGFKPEEWCPVGTVEFVEKYIRRYFGDVADRALRPMNVPECFLDNKMNTGRKIINISFDANTQLFDADKPLYIKDNTKIKNPFNGINTIKQAQQDGLVDIQCSEIIRDGHNVSEWRAFIHNGMIVDIKNYAGDPFVFPNMDTVVNSYMYILGDTLKEGTLDVYVDELDGETYVMECHKFFSCGLYGFDHPDILPLMYWRTYKEMIKQ